MTDAEQKHTLAALKFDADLNSAVHKLTIDLGCGHSEAVYQKGLLAMLRSMGYNCESERCVGVSIEDFAGVTHVVSYMKIDIIVHINDGVCVLELKCADRHEVSIKDQLRRYVTALKSEGVKVSLVFHVQFPKYCWRQGKDCVNDRKFCIKRMDINDLCAATGVAGRKLPEPSASLET